MGKIVKMCDMDSSIAVKVFEMLNPGQIKVKLNIYGEPIGIVTDTEPRILVYPEGWYYAKGSFRNKHMSSTGWYCEIRMEMGNGTPWYEIAKYCTLYVD